MGFNGRLGSDRYGSYYPTPITDPARLLLDSISAGGAHSCGIEVTVNQHGYVWCWGDNRIGQMGVGISPTLLSSWRPMRVVSDNVAGQPPGRAAIHCWGRNGHGQLGNLTTTASGYPVTAVQPQVIVVATAP